MSTTGRKGTADPNPQNIPVRTVEGQRIREAFVAALRLCESDYSPTELRIMARLRQDQEEEKKR